ncbi:hypothetical protein BH10PLA2_BH10PLA2_13210 [soil metagenome]
MPSHARRSAAQRRRTLSLERLEERVVLTANMIKDLNSVLLDPKPVDLTPVGSSLYFIYKNGDNSGLGKLDGSTFTPIDFGVANPFPDINNYNEFSQPQNLIAVGNTLYFSAWDGQAIELWTCNGTTAKEIKIGTYSDPSPSNFTAVGNTLYFTAYSSDTNNDLWKYDGVTLTDVSQTASPYLQPSSLYSINNTLYGFTYVSQVYQLFLYDGSAFSVLAAGNFVVPSNLVAFNDQLYWSATDTNSSPLLWNYNGTTWLGISVPDAYLSAFQNLTVANEALYFSGLDMQVHGQIWKYDGIKFTEIIDDGLGLISPPEGLIPFGNGICFTARNSDFQFPLFQYDGSVTTMVPGINANVTFNSLYVASNNLYFGANEIGNSPDLWRYDGATATQIPVGDSNDPTPFGFATLGNTLYFTAIDSSGVHLWSLDLPTDAPERNLLTSSLASSTPSDLTVWGSKIYFAATDGSTRSTAQLWSTDGTVAGTIPLGGPDSPSQLIVAGTNLYFTAPSGSGLGLFKYDGSSFSQIAIPPQFGFEALVAFDNDLYFTGRNSQEALVLWKYDGVNLTEIFTTNTYYIPSNLTAGADALYFVGPDDADQFPIYKYDGTTLTTLPPYGGGLQIPGSLLANGNQLYFTSYDNDNFSGYQIWIYDGITSTPLPTMGSEYYSATNLTLAGSKLFFTATRSDTYVETLFEYDGTVATPVNNVSVSYFIQLTAVGSDLYMAAYDASLVNQLWYVTGGVAQEIQVGSRFIPLEPSNLTTAGDLLYFTTTTHVDQYTTNTQLWVSSHGSAPLLVSVNPNGSSNAANLIGIGANLYLSATDGVHGDELWIVTPERTAPTVTPSTNSLPANATSLTITGTGFDTNPAKNAVAFSNGVTGVIVSATVTELVIGNLAGLTAGTNLSVIITVNGLASGDPVQVATVTAADPTNGSISGVVFRDGNASGVLNPGETGVGGQTVYLDLNNNSVLDLGEPTSFTVNGVFSFSNLAAGAYTVREVLLGGVILTAPATGSFTITLAAGDQASNQNFGNVLTSIVVPVQLPPTSAFPAQGNANANYVVTLFRDILRRNGDAAGLAYWTGLLDTGAATRLQVVQGINGSVEHYAQEIQTFYQTIFGRAAEPGGQAYWQQQLQQGNAEEAVVSAMLLTPEFLNRGDKNFIEFLYTSFLGRPPEAQGEAYWLEQLGDDATGMHVTPPNISRDYLIYNFVYSIEHVDRLVQGIYQTYLQRLPEFSALSAQAGSLLSYYYYPAIPFRSVAETVLSSDEFFVKAAANG